MEQYMIMTKKDLTLEEEGLIDRGIIQRRHTNSYMRCIENSCNKSIRRHVRRSGTQDLKRIKTLERDLLKSREDAKTKISHDFKMIYI